MLTLAEPSLRQWETFVAGSRDATPDAIDARASGVTDVVATQGPEEPFLSRWRRARGVGAVATGDAQPVGVADQELLTRRDRVDTLAGGAASLLSALSAGLTRGGYVVLLADADGVILHASDGGDFASRAVQTRLVPGARWSEGARGTNAIGTAIAERAPVAILGRAHLEERNHGLVCYAAPVFDPNGEIVGVVDVTSSVQRADDLAAVAVASMAAALERHVRARRLDATGDWRRTLAEMSDHGRAVFLVEPPGRVRAMSAAGVAMLAEQGKEGLGHGAKSSLVNPIVEVRTGDRELTKVDDLFGVDWLALQRAALGDAVLSTPSGRDRLHLEPLLDRAGQIVSVLVLVESFTRVETRGDPARVALTKTGITTGTKTGANAGTKAVDAAEVSAFAPLLGSDPVVVETKQRAARFARSRLPILLLAETGTGKELLARGIHAASDRRSRPFVALNCGALAHSVLESELFGYAPAAFTGARVGGQIGKIAAADGGTLLLDEVAEMPPSLQAMLLRVLEDGSFYRVGSHRLEHADVRLLCATCRDLPELVRTGRFRSDLYFRIKGVTLTLPPLRARDDLELLVDGLLQSLASSEGLDAAPTLSRASLALLHAHPWPGNIRELKIALQHGLVLADGAAEIAPHHLPADLQPAHVVDASIANVNSVESPSRAGAERSALDRALRACAGNLSDAARRLGVARSTLYRMLRRHGLDVQIESTGKGRGAGPPA